MVYAYDQWALLPVKDIYDTLMMLATINAAKDMYEKGAKQIEDFNKDYSDFYSNVSKDMDWHNTNVVNKMKETIDSLYSRGIDPLRSAEGRAEIARFKNSLDYGRIARNKLSAENAKEYVKNRAILDAAGKYDPDLEEGYLGYNLNNFSSEDGVWDRLSPVEAKSLKSLTESSFNQRTPHLLTEKDVTEEFGMEYDPRAKYKGFTYNDLVLIANTAAPGLRGTVYYDYYRNLAKQKLAAANQLDPDPNKAEQQIDEQLAKDIANSLIEYIVKPDPDYSDWRQDEMLRLKRISTAIAAQRAASRDSKTANGKSPKETSQFSYNDMLIGLTAANVLNKTSWGARIGIGGLSDYNPTSAGLFMKNAQKEIAENIYDYKTTSIPLATSLKFGFKSQIPSKTESLYNAIRKSVFDLNGNDIGSYENLAGSTIRGGATTRPSGAIQAAKYDINLHQNNLRFLQEISVPYSERNFAKATGRKQDIGNNMYVLMNKNVDKGRIYSADEVALTSAGVDRPADVPRAVQHTKALRKNFENRFVDGKTMMKSEGFVVGRVGADGAHHIFQKIRIANKADKPAMIGGSVYTDMYNKDEVIYYDMGIDTQPAPDFNITGEANMSPLITEQSVTLDRDLLRQLGVSSTNIKSDESIPDIYNLYGDEDDDLLDLMEP